MDQVNIRHDYFGDTTISLDDIGNVGKKVAWFNQQFMPAKENSIKLRVEAVEKKRLEGVAPEHEHALQQYCDETQVKKDEIECLKSLFASAQKCAVAAEIVFKHTHAMQDVVKTSGKVVELVEYFNKFVEACTECGVVDKNQFNASVSKMQLLGIKQSFEDLWTFLQKSTS